MIRRDPLFKGCTRPAMIFGVPVVPLFLVVFGIGFFSILTTVLLNFLTIGAVYLMRIIVKNDDQRFRIIGLWLYFRVQDLNRGFWKSAAYSPHIYKKKWRGVFV
ncbi:MAG: Type IV secretion system protein virB3 [Syntrophorhabdus sp. PtaU1.Bin153]|nr:MAG: Type IV secretion system protein virB3 [Syntrophorhabdus sp. PtaU1.Bin153]